MNGDIHDHLGHQCRPQIVRINAEDQTGYTSLLKTCSSVLHNGGVIAIPTDTIYGLAAIANHINAVQRIYEIKGRNFSKPVAVCVSSFRQIDELSHVTASESVLRELLPGPVTVVFHRKDTLNPELNPNTALVGFRMPAHRFVEDLCRQVDAAVALTSANRSQEMSTLSINEFEELWPQLDLVVDGGVLSRDESSRQGSTVVDLSAEGQFSIIRDGSALEQTVASLRKHGWKERTVK